MPTISKVQVITKYKGEIVFQDFFEKNPELFSNYISKSEFSAIYESVIQQTKNGMVSIITVTEHGEEGVSIEYNCESL
jgi:hypothetical protein